MAGTVHKHVTGRSTATRKTRYEKTDAVSRELGDGELQPWVGVSVSLSPSQPCPSCTTITSGYDLRKGQRQASPMLSYSVTHQYGWSFRHTQAEAIRGHDIGGNRNRSRHLRPGLLSVISISAPWRRATAATRLRRCGNSTSTLSRRRCRLRLIETPTQSVRAFHSKT
jgi:hypothetical protein